MSFTAQHPAQNIQITLAVQLADDKPCFTKVKPLPHSPLPPHTDAHSTTTRLQHHHLQSLDRLYHDTRAQPLATNTDDASTLHGADCARLHQHEHLMNQDDTVALGSHINLVRDPDSASYRLEDRLTLESLATFATLHQDDTPDAHHHLALMNPPKNTAFAHAIAEHYTQHATRVALANHRPLPTIDLYKITHDDHLDAYPNQAAATPEPDTSPTGTAARILTLMKNADPSQAYRDETKRIAFIERVLGQFHRAIPDLRQRPHYLDTLSQMLPTSWLQTLQQHQKTLSRFWQPDIQHMLRHIGLGKSQNLNLSFSFSTRFFSQPARTEQSHALVYDKAHHQFLAMDEDATLLAAEAKHRIKRLLQWAEQYLHLEVTQQWAPDSDTLVSRTETKWAIDHQLAWFERHGINSERTKLQLIDCLFFHAQQDPHLGSAVFSIIPLIQDDPAIKAQYAYHLAPLVSTRTIKAAPTPNERLDDANRRPSPSLTDLATAEIDDPVWDRLCTDDACLDDLAHEINQTESVTPSPTTADGPDETARMRSIFATGSPLPTWLNRWLTASRGRLTHLAALARLANATPRLQQTLTQNSPYLALNHLLPLYHGLAKQPLRLPGYDSNSLQAMMAIRITPDILLAATSHARARPLNQEALRRAYEDYLATGDTSHLAAFDADIAAQIQQFQQIAQNPQSPLYPDARSWLEQLNQYLQREAHDQSTPSAAEQGAATFKEASGRSVSTAAKNDFQQDLYQTWLGNGEVSITHTLEQHLDSLFPGAGELGDLSEQEELQALVMALESGGLNGGRGDSAFEKALVNDAREQGMQRAYRRLLGNLLGLTPVATGGLQALDDDVLLARLMGLHNEIELATGDQQRYHREQQNFFEVFLLARYYGQQERQDGLMSNQLSIDHEAEYVAAQVLSRAAPNFTTMSASQLPDHLQPWLNLLEQHDRQGARTQIVNAWLAEEEAELTGPGIPRPQL